MAMHLEACEDILSDRSVNPTNLDIYFELAKKFLEFLGNKITAIV
jgi:hypothetical protein